MQNRIKSNLDEKISSSTNYPNIDAFCDSIIETFKISSFPVDLNSICKARRINSVIVKPEVSHDAYIEIKKNEFQLTVKKELNLNNPKDRFLLAHEIAHTFQFELKSNVIVDKFFFLNGSKEQEYFSDYIARAILMPTKYLNEKISSWNGKMPSLKKINELILKFNVEYSKCLTRILNDLDNFDKIAILRFIQFSNDPEWKLFESFSSNDIRHNKEFFLPSRNFNLEKKFKDRLPSCGNFLNSFLEQLPSPLNDYDEFHVNITKEIFRDKPLTQLTSKISVEILPISITIKTNKYKSKIVNMLFDLDKTSPHNLYAASQLAT